MINPIILAQIGVGWLFIRYLIQKDYGTKEPRRALLLAGLVGLLATFGAIFLEKWLLPDDFISHPERLKAVGLFDNSLIVGVVEESLKSIPIAIFIYSRRYFNELNDGILYFGIGGMVFGVVEDIGYELAFPGSGIARLILGPYLHAGFCVLFGYALARRKVLKNGWWVVALGLIASIAFHGIYDFGIFYAHSWSLIMSFVITAMININIFYLLKRTRLEDAKLGNATAYSNYYCSTCGRPNPRRYLYCQYCGNKT